MEKITCARVGYGIIAKLHEKKLRDRGVHTVAVIDTDSQKREQAVQAGFQVFNSCAEAAKLNPDFWDICVGNSQHLNVIQQILDVDPQANILVEKPVCQVSEIPRLLEILENFEGKITVNENYASSNVTPLVKKVAFDDLKIQPRRIMVEMTKNRELDTARGRFVDYESGALRYEGPHMLAIIRELGEEYAPESIVASEFEDASIRLPQGVQPLFGQGIADIKYISLSGVEVELYTSLTGIVKHDYPPFRIAIIPREDTSTKYRIVAIEGCDRLGDEYNIIGFYEPINGFQRSEGAVAIIKNNEVLEVKAPIADDTMGTHLERTVQYFQGQQENPCSVETAIRIVEDLHTMFRHRLSRLQAEIEAQEKTAGIRISSVLSLPDNLLRHLLNWMTRQGTVSLTEVMAHTGLDEEIAGVTLGMLVEKGFVVPETEMEGELRYRVRPASRARIQLPPDIWQALARNPGGDA